MERLYIHGNQLRSETGITPLNSENIVSLIEEEFDKQPEPVTSLSLNNNGLTYISEIDKLINLTSLSFINNKLTNISGIDSLTNLTILTLNNNNIADISGIDNLTNLTSLSLNHNLITVIPESLGNLANLLYLYLNDNRITVIPESLGNLTNLTNLSLNNNRITVIPESFENLANLTRLYIEHNDITVIPELLGNLPNLMTLSFTGSFVFSTYKEEYLLRNANIYDYLIYKFNLQLYKQIYKEECKNKKWREKQGFHRMSIAFNNAYVTPNKKNQTIEKKYKPLGLYSVIANTRTRKHILGYLGCKERKITDVRDIIKLTNGGKPKSKRSTSKR